MTGRKGFTPAQKRDLIYLQDGICPECSKTINLSRGDEVEVDHRIPLEAGGTNAWHNMQAIHKTCHSQKTTGDRKVIARVKRKKAKHDGTFRKPRHRLPGCKDGPLKRKLNGGVQIRATGEMLREGHKK